MAAVAITAIIAAIMITAVIAALLTVSERKSPASELTPLDHPPFFYPLIIHYTVKIAKNTP